MVHHLYFHIPFCHRICPYCGFYKHQPGRVSFDALTDALLGELEHRAGEVEIQPRTVYLGGGTPSIFPKDLWERFAARMAGILDLSNLEEWTLEANPRTFDQAKAEAWKASGVTRVSLGVQSMDLFILERLGRDHSPKEAWESLGDLREAAIPIVNIDLMFSIPGQTLESWGTTLDEVLRMESEHVSAYNLTYEEDTPFLERFETGEWTSNSDLDSEFFLLAHHKLENAGFEHYEVSNYARPGTRSVHNQAYWQGSDYLGLGPSAVSTISGRRWKNLSDTAGYVDQVRQQGHAADEEECLGPEEKRLERLGLSLRTSNGMAIGEVDPKALQHLCEMKLVEQTGERVRLTLEGMMVADEVAAYLA